jgi:hypothetical protein
MVVEANRIAQIILRDEQIKHEEREERTLFD